MRLVRFAGCVALGCVTCACGDGGDPATGGGGAAAGGESSNGASSAEGGGAENAGGMGGESAVGGSGAGGTPAGDVADPNLDGPFEIAELDDSASSTSGNQVPVHAAYPTSGPSAGPYPVIVIGHGFQLPPAQYHGYVRRLATHGFIALTADFPAGFTGVNNVDNAQDMLAALDWVEQAPELAGDVNADLAGMSGHSMGGKLALLAASMDARVKASITLDPVDGSMNCSPQDCPDVSDLMPLSIPTAFVGETIDSAGGFMSCAPAADNFQTFYAGTTAPSISVTVLGANHMSFLDDVASCGFTCNFCNAATVDNATVNALSKAFVVAFYRRHLLGETVYDAFLTGAQAQTRYVETGLATITSK